MLSRPHEEPQQGQLIDFLLPTNQDSSMRTHMRWYMKLEKLIRQYSHGDKTDEHNILATTLLATFTSIKRSFIQMCFRRILLGKKKSEK